MILIWYMSQPKYVTYYLDIIILDHKTKVRGKEKNTIWCIWFVLNIEIGELTMLNWLFLVFLFITGVVFSQTSKL